MKRTRHHAVLALLAFAMAWCAVWSWGGLVERPGRFLGPAFTGGLLLAVVGAAGRTLRWRAPVVLVAQVLVVGGWLHHRLAGVEAWHGWFPTADSITRMTEVIRDGAVAVNTYAAPVSAEHPETHAYLLLAALLVILAVDLLGLGLGRTPWSGLPVIVALTVPISVLHDGMPVPVFVLTSVLYLLLLVTDEADHVARWPHGDGGATAADGAEDDLPDADATSVRSAAGRIGLVTIAAALVVPLLIPVTDGLWRPAGSGGEGGEGGTGDPRNVTLANPIVDLRRDLLRRDGTPLVRARTEATQRGYLRLTVLDRFTGVEWRPSARQLSEANRARGALPQPPGMSVTTPGELDEWQLEITDRFETTWLPTPYPTRRIDVDEGDWRYDIDTLDIARIDEPEDDEEIHYELTGFTPEFTAADLATAFSPPTDLAELMTALPDNLPSEIGRLAREVTAGAGTDYARAVALQDWFRTDGGFRYSLEPDSGTGMAQLVRFLTTDRVGYCEQYAAAMAVMARTLDLPSRVVVGFLSAHRQTDGSYLYTTDDLHAWPEIYFSGAGWVRFEPTPSVRTGSAPPWTTGRTTGGPATDPAEQAPGSARNPEPVDATGGPDSTTASPTESSSRWPWLTAGLAVLVLAALAAPGLWRRGVRRRRLDPTRPVRERADGLWTELLCGAVDLGVPLPPVGTLRDAARSLVAHVRPDPADVTALEDLVSAVERVRYARVDDGSDAALDPHADTVRRWQTLFAATAARRQVWSARWWPRSLVGRRGALPTTGHPSTADELWEVGTRG